MALSCDICYELYADFPADRLPRILPLCGHDFCTRCIAALCTNDIAPTCPKCRAFLFNDARHKTAKCDGNLPLLLDNITTPEMSNNTQFNPFESETTRCRQHITAVTMNARRSIDGQICSDCSGVPLLNIQSNDTEKDSKHSYLSFPVLRCLLQLNERMDFSGGAVSLDLLRRAIQAAPTDILKLELDYRVPRELLDDLPTSFLEHIINDRKLQNVTNSGTERFTSKLQKSGYSQSNHLCLCRMHDSCSENNLYRNKIQFLDCMGYPKIIPYHRINNSSNPNFTVYNDCNENCSILPNHKQSVMGEDGHCYRHNSLTVKNYSNMSQYFETTAQSCQACHSNTDSNNLPLSSFLHNNTYPQSTYSNVMSDPTRRRHLHYNESKLHLRQCCNYGRIGWSDSENSSTEKQIRMNLRKTYHHTFPLCRCIYCCDTHACKGLHTIGHNHTESNKCLSCCSNKDQHLSSDGQLGLNPYNVVQIHSDNCCKTNTFLQQLFFSFSIIKFFHVLFQFIINICYLFGQLFSKCLTRLHHGIYQFFYNIHTMGKEQRLQIIMIANAIPLLIGSLYVFYNPTVFIRLNRRG